MSSAKASACCLRPLSSNLKRINLSHKTPKTIGRTIETQITDLLVSRKQLELTADLNARTVTVKTLGKTFAGCNGFGLLKNESYLLKNGDLLEVRLGHHQYEVEFESEPPAKQLKLDTGNWEEINRQLLIFNPNIECDRDSIAAFDLDGTLIKTKSGARFPKTYDDWIFKFANIKEKIAKLHADYKIVILTNQSGLANDGKKISGFKTKIENIVAELKVPIQVFIATGRSIHRKPAPGMWHALQDKSSVDISGSKSFYVGDAAGRSRDWAPGMKADHSLVDRLLALNLKLSFYTPEEYFQKSSSVPYKMPSFDPNNLPVVNVPSISFDCQQVIVMVGSPGSGKSHFCRNYLNNNCAYVSRDQKGTWQKCVAELDRLLKDKKSVVVDNTNPDKESRARYVAVVKKYNVTCKCFLMDVSEYHAKHNNRFRELTDSSHASISDFVISSFFKSYQEPDSTEGFDEIQKIPFIPMFDNKSDKEQLYKMFLLEK